MDQLSIKKFHNDFTQTFEGDESGDLSPRQTTGVLYSKATPTPVRQPKLLAWSEELADELGIAPPDEKDVDVLAGNHVSPTMAPYAACYGGHQFGHWAGQLGDGRAITLGEWVAKSGESWEMQLKGAGPTAYSRMADGRAVLRSSVREYLMSEAMHYLGVPTTRALSLVTTGEQILRDMFYDGHPEYEPGAVVMRVAPSFLRFGNFQILTARNEEDNLRKLVDWTISRFYPHIQGKDRELKWFREVVDRTATMIVEWLRVGFVHGVMNTDNMSILGLTIDFGPYSFLDEYDPEFTPNTTDLPGRRYAFGRQATIGQWNLGALAGALIPLIPDKELLRTELEVYEAIISAKYHVMMGNKLGLDEVREEDSELITQWEYTLSKIKPDMTIFYQLLMDLPIDSIGEEAVINHFEEALYESPTPDESKEFYELIRLYIERIKANTCSREESLDRMRRHNPRFILRNYLLHQAIEELEKDKNELFLKLQEAIKDPYSNRFDQFFAKRPEWASKKAGCSMLSCSS